MSEKEQSLIVSGCFLCYKKKMKHETIVNLFYLNKEKKCFIKVKT